MARIETHPTYKEIIVLTEKEVNLIASAKPDECWMCDKIYDNIYCEDDREFLKRKWVEDEDLMEHLQQLINIDEINLERVS